MGTNCPYALLEKIMKEELIKNMIHSCTECEVKNPTWPPKIFLI